MRISVIGIYRVTQNTERRNIMANETKKSSFNAINIIIAVVLIAVIGLAAYAVYDDISTNVTREKMESGEMEANLAYLADQNGMSVEDFLTQYGLTGLDENATQTEVINSMTVENFLAYAGATLDELVEEYSLTEPPAMDANWGEVQKTFTVRNVIGEENFDQFKEMYGLDDTITLDTLWSEAEVKLEEAASNTSAE